MSSAIRGEGVLPTVTQTINSQPTWLSRSFAVLGHARSPGTGHSQALDLSPGKPDQERGAAAPLIGRVAGAGGQPGSADQQVGGS